MNKVSLTFACLTFVFSQHAFASYDPMEKERELVRAAQNGRLSARLAAEKFPYIDFIHQGQTQKHPQEKIYNHKDYKVTFIERYDSYGQDSLEWRLGDLKFEQYYDPKDFRITLAVTDMRTKKTYYSQERYEKMNGRVELVDVYFDSKNQVEYWYDDIRGFWVAEDPDTFDQKTYHDRKSALKDLKNLEISEKDPCHIFSPPAVLRAQKEAEDREYYADKPRLWTAAFMGYLSLSGEIADRMRSKINNWFTLGKDFDVPSKTIVPVRLNLKNSVTSWITPFAALTMSGALQGKPTFSKAGFGTMLYGLLQGAFAEEITCTDGQCERKTEEKYCYQSLDSYFECVDDLLSEYPRQITQLKNEIELLKRDVALLKGNTPSFTETEVPTNTDPVPNEGEPEDVTPKTPGGNGGRPLISEKDKEEYMRTVLMELEGKAQQNIVEVLESDEMQKELDLSQASFRGGKIKFILPVFHFYPSLEALNLTRSNLGLDGAESIKELAKIKNLKALELSGNGMVVKGASEALGTLVGLRTLKVQGYSLSDKDVQNFTRLTNLTSLDLNTNLIERIGLEAIGKVTSLTSLDISRNSKIQVDDLYYLLSLHNLKLLSFSGNQLDSKGIKTLSILSSLTTLKLNHVVSRGSDPHWKTRFISLGKLSSLKKLELEWNNIGNSGITGFKDLTNLTSLKLSRNNINDEGVSKELMYLTGLTSLKLHRNKIGNEGAKKLANLTNLRSLVLGANNIGNEGARAFMNHPSLTSLDLSHNSRITEGLKDEFKLHKVLENTRLFELKF